MGRRRDDRRPASGPPVVAAGAGIRRSLSEPAAWRPVRGRRPAASLGWTVWSLSGGSVVNRPPWTLAPWIRIGRSQHVHTNRGTGSGSRFMVLTERGKSHERIHLPRPRI